VSELPGPYEVHRLVPGKPWRVECPTPAKCIGDGQWFNSVEESENHTAEWVAYLVLGVWGLAMIALARLLVVVLVGE
jgi:hypothetical protein